MSRSMATTSGRSALSLRGPGPLYDAGLLFNLKQHTCPLRLAQADLSGKRRSHRVPTRLKESGLMFCGPYDARLLFNLDQHKSVDQGCTGNFPGKWQILQHDNNLR